MPKYKLTDIQNVTLVVANGGAVVNPAVVVTHGLKDADGNYVNPDEVHLEQISGAGAGVDMCLKLQVTRPGVPNGTITLDGEADSVAGADWTYVYRVVCKYYHSIQSKDHTV